MVCPRCIASVEQLLQEQQIPFRSVQLGEVNTAEALNEVQKNLLRSGLEKLGFELLGDPNAKIIEQVKIHLIQKVQQGVESHFSIQKYLSNKIFREYSSVSKLFSEVEGITIEQFFILQKIERAKELIVYNEQSLQEVSIELGYSSSQHLSAQFKRVTGMTPSRFKEIGNPLRKNIDRIK